MNKKGLASIGVIIICLIVMFNHYSMAYEIEGQSNELMAFNDAEFLIYQAHIFKAIGYSKEFDGAGVKVAIVDSGINMNHEDLNAELIQEGYNYTSEDIGDVRDQTGHGTFIAGIIGAQENNSLGIVGLTPKVEIIPIKCFADDLDTDIDTVVRAIDKAIELKVDVINLSFTTEEYSHALEAVIKKAINENIIIVASSGNDLSGKVYYPASFEQVVSVNSIRVEAVGMLIQTSSLSNSNDEVIVSAPGDDILSLSHLDDSGYKLRSGSSYATAIVSSVAIMMKQKDSQINGDEFIELLKKSYKDNDDENLPIVSGYGIIHIENLIKTHTTKLSNN